MSIEELKKDAGELASFLAQAQRQRVKEFLTSAKHQIELEIVNLEIKEKAKSNISPSTVKKSADPKRYCIELTEYAFDQSDKYVKLFVTLPGVQALKESDVTTSYTNNSMKLSIQNLNNKDYVLIINNLLSKIDIPKSYHKIKTDIIVVYIKKGKEGEKWSHLTTVEKRVKQIKEDQFKSTKEVDENRDDPSAGIMNMMKKMYQSGDPDTKRMIAKAWTESQEKTKGGMGGIPGLDD